MKQMKTIAIGLISIILLCSSFITSVSASSDSVIDTAKDVFNAPGNAVKAAVENPHEAFDVAKDVFNVPGKAARTVLSDERTHDVIIKVRDAPVNKMRRLIHD